MLLCFRAIISFTSFTIFIVITRKVEQTAFIISFIQYTYNLRKSYTETIAKIHSTSKSNAIAKLLQMFAFSSNQLTKKTFSSKNNFIVPNCSYYGS